MWVGATRRSSGPVWTGKTSETIEGGPDAGRLVVYFLIADNDRVKIGQTEHLEDRLRTLRLGGSARLELWGWAYADESLEGLLHDFLADDRVHGEWFRLSPRLIWAVQAVERLGAEYFTRFLGRHRVGRVTSPAPTPARTEYRYIPRLDMNRVVRGRG